MAMGWDFSVTHPILFLMRRGSILINGFKKGLEFFLKTQDGFGYCLALSRLYIKLILKLD